MKSGNKIVADRVKECNFKIRASDGAIYFLKINQRDKGLFKARNIIQIKSINLSQIECITKG
jgi:hypothetical protein